MSARISKACVICRHTQRLEIELALASGVSQKAVATKYALSKDMVWSHWHRHVDEERRMRLLVGPVQRHALSARVAEESTNVINQLRVIRAGLFDCFDAAMKAGDRFAASQLSGRLHENLRITAGITGELAQSPLVTINNQQTNVTALMDSPQFAAFQATLIRILGRFPDAREAVVTEFERLERAAAPQTVVAPLPALEHANVPD